MRFAAERRLLVVPRQHQDSSTALILELHPRDANAALPTSQIGRAGARGPITTAPGATPDTGGSAAAAAPPQPLVRHGHTLHRSAGGRPRWCGWVGLTLGVLLVGAFGVTVLTSVPAPTETALSSERTFPAFRVGLKLPAGWHVAQLRNGTIVTASAREADWWALDWLRVELPFHQAPGGTQISIEHILREQHYGDEILSGDGPPHLDGQSAEWLATRVLHAVSGDEAELRGAVRASTLLGRPALRFVAVRRGRWVECIVGGPDQRLMIVQLSAANQSALRQSRPVLDAVLSSIRRWPR